MRHHEKLNVRTFFDSFNNAFALPGNGGNDGPFLLQYCLQEFVKFIGNTFHLTYFVDYYCTDIGIKKSDMVEKILEGSNIHPIFAHSVTTCDISVRKRCPLAVKAY